ncbi:hypothetical protein [Bradyrhizobium icense]
MLAAGRDLDDFRIQVRS